MLEIDPVDLRKFRTDLGISQQEMADRLSVGRSAYATYESGRNKPPTKVIKSLLGMGLGAEVTLPKIPAAELGVPLVSIGWVSASSKADWTDPFESEDFEYVPGHMAEKKGLFCCRVQSDSMVPLLMPGDTCIFERLNAPKIGCVTLHRDKDNRITIKQLKHDGAQYVLHPLNSSYEDELATGESVAVLVGIVRKVGGRTLTDFDPDGIRP